MSEVLGDDPLAEGVLPALHHARTHLLARGGAMLPSAVAVVAALVALCVMGLMTEFYYRLVFSTPVGDKFSKQQSLKV